MLFFLLKSCVEIIQLKDWDMVKMELLIFEKISEWFIMFIFKLIYI